MKIKLQEISVKEVFKGFKDNQAEGVVGYDGILNIRPIYQREFIYKDAQRDAVINTVYNNFPLNVMYWAKNFEDSYELLDGQQRTLSLCQYINGNFSMKYLNGALSENPKFFHNLTEEEKNLILDYKLMVYICEGTDKEKLEWFTTINIAGEKLSNQELRNAVYIGEWLTDAKRHFSKINCVAYSLGKEYLYRNVIRQEYLEKAIGWIAAKYKKNIEDYMAEHQHDKDANNLWQYFQNVINWTKTIFFNYRKDMKGVEWGILYNKYKDVEFNAVDLEKKIKELMIDDDVTSKSGIYEYLLSGQEKTLNIRAFSPSMKSAAYEKQKGICLLCKKHFNQDEMEGDHITPWHLGGQTTATNCQMLCKLCNRTKSGK